MLNPSNQPGIQRENLLLPQIRTIKEVELPPPGLSKLSEAMVTCANELEVCETPLKKIGARVITTTDSDGISIIALWPLRPNIPLGGELEQAGLYLQISEQGYKTFILTDKNCTQPDISFLRHQSTLYNTSQVWDKLIDIFEINSKLTATITAIRDASRDAMGSVHSELLERRGDAVIWVVRAINFNTVDDKSHHLSSLLYDAGLQILGSFIENNFADISKDTMIVTKVIVQLGNEFYIHPIPNIEDDICQSIVRGSMRGTEHPLDLTLSLSPYLTDTLEE